MIGAEQPARVGAETIVQSELFALVAEPACRELAALGTPRRIAAGDVIFRRGDPADEVFVVLAGRVELTVPLVVLGETRDTRFQSLGPGQTLAWSALVPPHLLTMGARATTDVELLAFDRGELLQLFFHRPEVGHAVMSRLARVIAARLHEMAELWTRELERNVAQAYR